jgi:hypothetical protein
VSVAEYLPDHGGRWLAAVRDEALLLMPADRADDLRALWPRLGDGDAAALVIDRLAASGISAAPSFALVVRERSTGTARALVRGDLRVSLGDLEVSGVGVSTWQERAVDGHPSVRVGAPDTGDGPRLPIVEGVVAASVVDWGAAAPSVEREPEGERVTPGEQTMVPEDTIVGVSRTERPRIAAAAPRPTTTVSASGGATAPAPAPDVVIVPPDFGSAPPARPDPAPVVVPAQPSAGLGDHDGLTVARADLRRLGHRRDGQTAGAGPDDDAASGPDASVVASPPPLALRLPDGSIEPIVGELVLGRAPAIGRVSGTRVPRPVVIGAGDPDISRTHLRVAVEGGTAVVTDLESRNGTHVVAPGQPPMRLRPSEPTPVLPDTVIDLGGGWSIQVVMR